MTFEKGQIVKYANPVSAEEAALRMTVIEDREDRVLVQHIVDRPLRPTECFAKSNYVLAGE